MPRRACAPGRAAGGGLLAALLPLIASFLQNGGLNKILAGFQQKGMSSQAASWVGTGDNEAVSGADLEQVIGSDQISAIAEQSGLSNEQAADAVAEVLPQVVDLRQPRGRAPGRDRPRRPVRAELTPAGPTQLRRAPRPTVTDAETTDELGTPCDVDRRHRSTSSSRAVFIASATVPRWCAHRIGDQVDGSITRGRSSASSTGSSSRLVPIAVGRPGPEMAAGPGSTVLFACYRQSSSRSRIS